ncbi:MAG: M20/M25/M40 family metallo-hydrolase [Anaerolineae bacterium]|nr:M20/M25/M40 family metallo-hydrolase [Anaerolineae bacterium]
MHNQTKRRGTIPALVLTIAVLLALLWQPVTISPVMAQDPPRLPGFTMEQSTWEREYESLFQAIPDPNVASEHSIALTSHPTLVSTDGDWQNVQYSMDKLREYGLEPELVTYYVYLSVPRNISVEMVAPSAYTAKVKENGWPWHENFDDVVVGYNAYSPAGEVTAELVYVNYGVPEDYALLEGLGIDVEGKIAIARYGGVFRGVKAKVAYEHGAAGLILFSDPADDGFVRGPVYPDGPWRPDDAIQRGSILYIFDYVGDPLTPGWASTENARRLPPERASNLPQGVPTTPLAYGQAAPLLEAMGGPEAPAEWQGALPFTYHLGPGPATVHLNLEIDYEIAPIWDIVVKIPGTKYPDQWVIAGAHRDGWTYGTNDSNSGYIVVMEMARALSQLMQEGWQPERTIVLAGWDGEEYGLLGSTEWGEEFQQELRKNAVAYINLDGAGGGQYFSASAVPALDQLLYDVTKEVEEPRTPGASVYDDWSARQGGNVPRIGRLGGGSDYSVFLDFLGVPSISMGFGSPGGVYHSAYDDLYFMENWGDPGYLHHAAAARVAGLAALRLANANILPFEYSKYAGEISGYLDRLNNLQIDLYGEVMVDFGREMQQAQAWQATATEAEARAAEILDSNPSLPQDLEGTVVLINDKFIRLERDLTQAKGLPDRSWFKHVIYAPGLYTGYAVQYLSALEDSLVMGEWPKVRNYKALLHNSLTTATNTSQTAARAK